MASARHFFNQRVTTIKGGDGDLWIDSNEADMVLAEYDMQCAIPVKYEVVVHAAYRVAKLRFDSPFEATNFMRMWVEHVEFNEDEAFSMEMKVYRIDEDEELS